MGIKFWLASRPTAKVCKKHKMKTWHNKLYGCLLCYYSNVFLNKFYHLKAIENIAGYQVELEDRAAKYPAVGYKEIWDIKPFDSVALFEQAERLPELPGVWSIWQGRHLLDVAETQNMNYEAKLFVRKLIDPPNLKYYEFKWRAHKGLKFKIVKAPVVERQKRLVIEEAYAVKHAGKLSRWSPAPYAGRSSKKPYRKPNLKP